MKKRPWIVIDVELLGLGLFLAPLGLAISLMALPMGEAAVNPAGWLSPGHLSQISLDFLRRLLASLASILIGAKLSKLSSPDEKETQTQSQTQSSEKIRLKSSFWRSVTLAIPILTVISLMGPWRDQTRHLNPWALTLILGLFGERSFRKSVERGLLFGYVFLSIFFVFAKERLFPLESGFGFLMGVLMLAGTALILWERSNFGRGLLWGFLIFTSLLALVSTALAPWAWGTLRAVARALLSLLNTALNLALIPIGYVAGFLISKIKSLMKEPSNPIKIPFQMGPNRDLLEKAKKTFETPFFMKMLGWLLAAAILSVLGYLLWRYLTQNESRNESSPHETRENQWSSRDAIRWAARASKKIFAAILPKIEKERKGKYRNPVQAIYMKFLSACEKKGYPRKTSETPLEFAENLGSKVPQVRLQAQTISETFSLYLYSGKIPQREEITRLQRTFDEFCLSLDNLSSKSSNDS